MPGYVVCRSGDLADGEKMMVAVNDREIAIFNVEGSFFAVRNRCPHMGGPLCTGNTVAELRSTGPGSYDHGGPRTIVRCPWHQWEFDVRTGQSWADRRLRTRAYAVTVERGEELQVHAAAGTERVPGPYQAETYRVDVDGEYLVVHVD